MKNSMKPADWCWLFGVIILGCGMRFLYLSASHFIIDSDEAIVGLMAKHILETGNIPVFYYGQHYMGSLEPITAAILFRIFGSSNATLHAAPFFWFFLSQIAFFKLCLENISRINARIAGLLFAVAPIGFIEWSTKARGGFIEIIFLITFALLFLMRAVRENRIKQIRFNLCTAAFILGVGWWVNNQIVYLFPFAGIVFLITLIPFGLKNLCLVTTMSFFCFLFGGSPYWIYNIIHSGASFGMFHLASFSEAIDHAKGTFQHAVPIILGTRGFNQNHDIIPGAWIIANFVLLYSLYKGFNAFLTSRFSFHQRIMIGGCIISVMTILLVFVISRFGSLSIAPRYLLPFYIFFLPLVAVHAEQTKRKYIRSFPVIILLVLSLTSNYWGGTRISGQPIVHHGERVSKDNQELLSWLASENIHLVRTNYWIGYRLAFESNEAVRFLIFQPPRETRIKAYEDLVKSEQELLETPLVVTTQQAIYIREALQTLDVSFRETHKSGYFIFDKLSLPWLSDLKEVQRDSYQVSTDLHPEEVMNMIDDNLETRWASHKPQSPGMSFQITFQTPQLIRLIDLDVGKFKNDFPRTLQVEVKTPQDTGFKEIYSDQSAKSIQYFLDSQNDSGIFFKPTILTNIQVIQTGKDSFFDWSVAELKLFQ
jgi:hypothetical protein